jgi:hypothetical protein
MTMPAFAEVSYPFQITLKPGQTMTLTNSPSTKLYGFGKCIKLVPVPHGVKVVAIKAGGGTVQVRSRYFGTVLYHKIKVTVSN